MLLMERSPKVSNKRNAAIIITNFALTVDIFELSIIRAMKT